MPRPHDFSTSLLGVFVEVARLGSFTAAAAELDYTQSAVSRQISALEDEAGAVLFDRLPRGVRLTEPGRRLLGHAQAVLEHLGTARRELADLRELATGRLRVGA
ncbi:MAG TPA: LysR family transcriptional regulator, partial [Umezawaea sp.]|nr:LysR family transcriptional regulator [Umezawaea sp.]